MTAREPSPEAKDRADLLVAQFLARQRPGQMPAIGVTELLLGIAAALDDLAEPLAALLEGIEGGEAPDSEAFRMRVRLAQAALWRFRGHAAGGIG